MKTHVSVTDAARNFSDYVNRVAFQGERFVLVRGRKPVAELVPIPQGRRLGDLPGLLASLPHLSPEEAEDFGRDVEAARSELGELPEYDPWES